MIELIFVIVVIGILSAVAIPRLAATRDDAIIVKAKSEVAAIRSGIAMQKSKNLLGGHSVAGSYYPAKLDNAAASTNGEALFWFNDGNSTNVLENPIYSKNSDGHWIETNSTTYVLHLNSGNISFTYKPTTGLFDCHDLVTPSNTTQKCKDLTQ
jgi:general secretion pathway protein G